MARYIDLEEFERRIKAHIKADPMDSISESALIEWCKDKCIRQAYAMPRADVVPKSEVDELKQYCSNREEEVMRLHKELADMLTSEQTELHIPMEYAVRVRVKHPVYKAIKSEVAKEIFAEIEFDIANLDFDRDETRSIAIEGIIANLKKKYTEGEK